MRAMTKRELENLDGAGEIRDRILRTAREAFYRTGITAVTMERLASQLAISKKTLYRYFGNKAELVRDVFQAACLNAEREMKDILQNPNADFQTRFQNFVASLIDIHSEMSPALVADLQRFEPDLWNYRRERIRSWFDRVIDDGIAAATFEPDIPKDVTILMLESILECMLKRPAQLEINRKTLDVITGVTLQGIMTDNARKKNLQLHISRSTEDPNNPTGE